ncbi:MAG: primosomal protein N' [Deltaproteobacteria bacterium]|nr:primosomal protein N' [Deltaproteobacteria bacterium]
MAVDLAALAGHEALAGVAPARLRRALSALVEAGAVGGGGAVDLEAVAEEMLSPEGPLSSAGEGRAVTLTQEQRDAVGRVRAAQGYEAFLLHGVTGSGKTEVYLELIAEVLARGQSALVLVPEIGLTPQTIRRFKERLRAPVVAWHSALTGRERLEAWCAAGAGEPAVVVGARSALFTPLPRLGLIVVDEAHDSSYKQGEGVRYHGSDMAVLRAQLEGCPVVLGSATPSLESVHNAHQGKFTLLQLRARPVGVALPAVRVVDMRTARTLERGAPNFSLTLLEALRARLARGEQSILFLNRRGFSQSVRCVSCGLIFKCPACLLPLPWHQRTQRLECHHCDLRAPLPHACPDCGRDDSFAPIGRGTERVEAQLKEAFPNARVERLDRDSDLSPLDLERRMRAGDVDILVGTQMVTKGHDFPRVTLVGVLDADGGLDLPDFRAAERSYQLLSQVAGRAGRADLPGEVLIQTHRPQDELILAAATHDFGRFCAHELRLRQLVGYPPFGHMCALRLEGPPGPELDAALAALAAHAQRVAPPVIARGPSPAPIEQLRGRRRFLLLLRAPRRDALHAALRDLCAVGGALPDALSWAVDVDPASFL